MMNLNEYQTQARSTAIYDRQNFRMVYPALGLIGECGELAEKVKKLIRDSNNKLDNKRKEQIKGELGDCFWYLANTCSDLELTLDSIFDVMRYSGFVNEIASIPLYRVVFKMATQAAQVGSTIDEICISNPPLSPECINLMYPHIKDCLSCIFFCLNEIATKCEIKIDDVLQSNLDKLFSRKERGVIQGDGDNR